MKIDINQIHYNGKNIDFVSDSMFNSIIHGENYYYMNCKKINDKLFTESAALQKFNCLREKKDDNSEYEYKTISHGVLLQHCRIIGGHHVKIFWSPRMYTREEAIYKNGSLHCEFGPARTLSTDDVKLLSEFFCLHGCEMSIVN